MRLGGIAAIVFVLALAFVMSGSGPAATAQQLAGHSRADNERSAQAIFRYDTFDDEQLWTDVLRMHAVIATVDPAATLAVGLKVDVEALPRTIRRMPCGLPQDNTVTRTLAARAVFSRWKCPRSASGGQSLLSAVPTEPHPATERRSR